MYLVCRTSPVVMALSVGGRTSGLLNNPARSLAGRWIVAFLLLDFVRYAVHWAFHAVPFLWRIHAVHHSDPDYDVSTAARFHPIEAVLAQGGYLALVALLAPPPVAVFAAETITDV